MRIDAASPNPSIPSEFIISKIVYIAVFSFCWVMLLLLLFLLGRLNKKEL